MFKKGFTLQEMLLSMLIVGIVAVIAAPGISTLAPDQTKAKYLKSYNLLSTLTSEILDDSSLYWTTYNNNGTPTCRGMGCRNNPQTYTPCTGAWTCNGNLKFPAILATKINTSARNQNNNAVTFTTLDGVQWTFNANATNNAGIVEIQNTVQINIDPNDNANQCVYNNNNCRKPKQFTFTIDNDGGIQATDFLGRAFLENTTKLNDTQNDYNRAATLSQGG